MATISDLTGTTAIVVSATFAADPLQPPLQFWVQTLDIDADVTLAPYGQVMQELLSPASLSNRNTAGYNLLLIRPDDWIRDRLVNETPEQNIAHMRRCASELAAAVQAHRGMTAASLLVFLCPCSTSTPAAYGAAICELQTDLASSFARLANVHCFSHADLSRLYALAQYEDPWADRLGHIPYTDEYFAALATLLARRVAALSKPPYKVIALDCDNTLWQGICGEVGAGGIELTAAHVKFQQLLVRQHDAGVLLCLCSKNNPADVDEVFSAHPEMPLRKEHLVCSRVNWASKSSNLQELARELDLSLDSFVFIDDSARECAEVQDHCSSVLTLHFPEDLQEIEHFLAHVWAFDRLGSTQEAQRRTQQYKDNLARHVARDEAGSLENFFASLELQVDVADMQAEHIARVAELVQRTNQFNLTGVRRGRSEIETLWKTGQLRCLVVHVRDRFGDHGLVGATLLHESSRVIEVDTFVLSCRVLGLGVEHQIVQELARRAGRQFTHLALRYNKTPRNQPAWNFLQASFAQFGQQLSTGGEPPADCVFTVPLDNALTVRRNIAATGSASGKPPSADPGHASPSQQRNEWHSAAYRLSRMPDLLLALRSSRQSAQRRRADYVAPRTSVEAAVAEIWAEVLSVERVGVNDDFFALGGDSLQAVRALSRIVARLGRQLPLGELFESASVESIAARLASAPAVNIPIARAATDCAPLSSAQLRLWLIDQLERGSEAYHICEALRLRGPLDQTALQRSLNDLVRRHESLRTMFRKDGAEPVQQLMPEASFRLKFVDLTSFGSDGSEAEATRQIQQEASVAFDLSAGPLIRGRLLRLSPHEHVLVMTMHHIISDGWSVGVLLRELGLLYTAHREGRPEPLPHLPLRYIDYATWQRGCLSEPPARERMSYWRDALRDAPQLLDLPTDRPRPRMQSFRGASVSLSLGTTLSEGLQKISRRFDVTQAMALYSAWVVLLARLSGKTDIVVGMPAANRPRAELEGLVGFFVNTLAVRVSVDFDSTVSELVRRVRTSMLGAYVHQDVPFDRVVEELRPSRSLSQGTLFQVMFALQNAPRTLPELAGLAVIERDVPAQAAQYDLTLLLRESPTGLIGSIHYAADLFEHATIERWAALFKAVLIQMLRGPNERVGTLRLISAEEHRHLIDVCNQAHAAYPQDQCVEQLFEEQVRRSPGSIAIAHGDEVVTYASLNAKANRLAHFLKEQGTQIGEFIPVLMSRGVQIVIAQLAVLKAGAVYVPLDPAMPAARMAFVLQDCRARCVLTDQRRPAELHDLQVQWLDCREISGGADDRCAENLTLSLPAHHAAYVMYTSGSTGHPKGVCVPHRAISRLAINNGYLRIEATDCIAHCSNPAFDASTFEIWGALLNGARLVVIDQHVLLEPQQFAAALVNGAVSTLFLTTAVFNRYADAIPETLVSLQSVLFGGEAADPGVIRRLLQVGRPGRLLHMYGPTESTTFATAFQVEAVAEGLRNLPIGHPVASTRVYILDSQHQPVPIDVVGEIHIGGAGVALGYVNRPQLTAERFVPDEFSSEPHARMYRTGDLGRWRCDGQIEFLGRSDGQVKIRGLRIELGEIEAHLVRHSRVREAVVVAWEDVRGEKRLVAYIKSVSPDAVSAEELRAYLQAVLPRYMIPCAFVMLEQFPLTANSKLDRRALPAPSPEAHVRHEYATPRGEMEQVLAQIWQELLGVESVGRQDNFFELGGHSLLIVQMLERLRQVGLPVKASRVFECPALSDLAGALLQGDDEEADCDAPPNLIPTDCEAITPQMLPLVELEMEHIEHIARCVPGGVRNIQDIYPLAPLQEGILFHHLLSERGADTYVVPILLSVGSREQLEQLLAALQGVIDRHDMLRAAVMWEQLPRAVQVVHRRVSLPVEEVTLDAQTEVAAQLQEWMRVDRRRMDLRHAPLLRLRIAADPRGPQWYVRLQLHHIAGDNTAQEIVTSEIVAHLEGRAQTLPPAAPYRQHVAQVLAYERTCDAEGFFRSKLARIDGPTAPFGLLDVHGDGGQIEAACDEIASELTQRIHAQARRYAVSVATLFHAAWALVVAHTSGRDDVVFGTVLLGRLLGRAGAQRTLGMFINTLPLRLRLSDVSAKDLIARTQTELAQLLTHEQASLASAQRASGLGSVPLFSTLLNYRHRLVDLGAVLAQVPGLQMLGRVDRTNYPITLCIDDCDSHFALTVHTDRRLDPRRLATYLQTALHSLVDALEHKPEMPALQLPILPAGEQLPEICHSPAPAAHVIHEYEAPQGEVEQLLAQIWQELLGVQRVGRRDDFFRLGGHSLLIVQMLEQLRQVGLSVPVRRVFASPTLADLAGVLRQGEGETQSWEVPPNLIPADCEAITPQMLPLVELEMEHIEHIVQCVPGGERNVQDIYPLAPLQEGILFHHLLDEHGADAYVVPILLSVGSRQQLEELLAAFQGVIDRHDILRTAVLWEQLPRAVQVVYRRASLPTEEVMLDGRSDVSAQLQEWMQPQRQRMDLQQAPLLRLRIAADPHGLGWYVIIQTHHLTLDHISIEAVIVELLAHLDGRAQMLPPAMPYRQHVAQVLAYQRTGAADNFFRSKLAEIEEPTAPFGLLDVHGDGGEIEEAHANVESELTQRIRAEARRSAVSVATLFHAAWALVVAYTSGRDDVVFGTVLLGRQQGTANEQGILGIFMNTLPLRLRLRGVSCRELIEQTRQELAELLDHEQASLAVAQRCSGISGSAPLFTALLNYRHSAAQGLERFNRGSMQILAAQERTNYPLTLSVDDLGVELALKVQTQRRIDPGRIIGYVRTAMYSMLEALERAPHTPTLSLAVLPELERQQIIDSFNATRAGFSGAAQVHELFEAQARRTPAAIAVSYAHRSLTYGEINRRANQLARYLRSRGVGPGQLAAICVERSPQLLVALLGVMKAGAAYVPLDPSYPSARLRDMLEDAAPAVLLTRAPSNVSLQFDASRCIALDEQWCEIAAFPEENLSSAVTGLTSQDPVYVIYTSGSTGQPKGTIMPHCAMVNLIEWHRSCFPAGAGKRVLQFAALSFDVAFQEIFSTLCSGGALVLLDEWVRRDARALLELLCRASIEGLFVTPLVLQSLAECAQDLDTSPTSIQDVIVAGEQLRITPEISSFFRRLRGARLHNHYGPTETHVVTTLTLPGNSEQWPVLPAIGSPLSNVRIHVMDQHLRALPIGVAGEIHVGGVSVARGYVRRPELTRERFIPDPFSTDPQARLYKTGDLGRWRADGTLEYLGRMDDQLKIRGYRIEPGEIEAHLVRHEGIKDAAVVAREDAAGVKRLIAYVSSSGDHSLDVEEVRAHLAAELPEYMVPSTVTILDRLPLTPTGKLNRRDLQAREPAQQVSNRYDPPRGEVEETLARIWKELLHAETIGRQDNFFELGGHSLIGMRLGAKVTKLLGAHLPAVAIFKYPTLLQMAEFVTTVRNGAGLATKDETLEFQEEVLWAL